MKSKILLTILLVVAGGIASAAEVNPLVNATQIRGTDGCDGCDSDTGDGGN